VKAQELEESAFKILLTQGVVLGAKLLFLADKLGARQLKLISLQSQLNPLQ
jgi:hypothetical protein